MTQVIRFTKKLKGEAAAEQGGQITMLEELLFHAHAGRLKGIAIAGVVDPFDPPTIPVAIMTYHTPDMGNDYYTMIGALEDLKFEMLMDREIDYDGDDGDGERHPGVA